MSTHGSHEPSIGRLRARVVALRSVLFATLCLGMATPFGSAQAHFFTQPYTLPVPFTMYAWGATAALVLSFVIVRVFASTPPSQSFPTDKGTEWSQAVPPFLLRLGRSISVMALFICMVTGWVGTQAPLDNLNMTLFWIVFVLCIPYLCAIVGDFYAAINPWRVLVNVAERLIGTPFTGAFKYPARLRHWPALMFYVTFIWIELFAQLAPRGLANALLAYTIINFMGAWAFGTRTWFEYGELFAVLLRLIGRMAPVAWNFGDGNGDASQTRVSFRAPFSGLVGMKVESLSMVLFILFMLSSTAYDGLHATAPWVTAYWRYLYPTVAPLLDPTAAGQIAAGTQLYHAWQAAMLLVSPWVYLGVFWLCVVLAKRLLASKLNVKELLLRFAPTLIPIAFVYHVTHYYTILLSQGGQLVRLVSDPFGVGWNIFGTATSLDSGLFIQVNFIWHSQVALILFGHIVSVYLAHLAALQVFNGARAAAISQLPMLVLMVLFTTFGLWILSLPLAAGS